MTLIEIIAFLVGLILIGIIIYFIVKAYKADYDYYKRNTWVNANTGEHYYVNEIKDCLTLDGKRVSKVFFTSLDDLQEYMIDYENFILNYQPLEEYERSKKEGLRS